MKQPGEPSDASHPRYPNADYADDWTLICLPRKQCSALNERQNNKKKKLNHEPELCLVQAAFRPKLSSCKPERVRANGFVWLRTPSYDSFVWLLPLALFLTKNLPGATCVCDRLGQVPPDFRAQFIAFDGRFLCRVHKMYST